ncbi:IclR family transcriptional regulator [Ruegeria sp. 2012CJ41-6]|uniref:IclR family transcriptional regulator n=1 Tax=Ruegeria spongiae TaxID=2942209 RepID=A0ABT0PXS2_9RHOB|nr:IclR family transcriptional regulator [Ruegeria spongiae]MCL6282406.1 IclR family transcriptional regulator [Ruegeria spongiae]
MPDSDKRYANTLARGLSILRAFRPTDNGLGNLDLSERTGIPRSTVSRLTFTLCALGYLTHGRHHDKYRLGPAALALGNIAAASFSFVEIATSIMQRLADETATLIGVSIQDDGKMLMVKTWRPAGSPSIWLDVGYRMPMLSSSSGAAYVGALTDEETAKLAALLPEDQGQALTRLTEQAREQLLAKGYAFVSGPERFAQSINALATPYRPSEFGAPVAFFSGATSDALSDDRIHDSVGPALARAVDELRRATGQGFPAIAPH